jgi:propanol-preferring alcohol dehydrogenase
VVGEVEEAGEGATRFRAGDRVGVIWLHETCGECEHCRAGNENLCRRARFTGFHADGGYAEYLTAPEEFVYPIPGQLDAAATAPLLCAGVIGYRALRLCGAEVGGRVGLYGFGASAHIAIQVARHWGCEVAVMSRSREHRELAESLGAAWTGSVEDELPWKLDGAVMFAPAGALVPPALAHLDRGGTLALAGIYMSEIPPLDYEEHLYQERTLRSVTASTRRDARELLTLAAEIPIRTEVETYALEEANDVLLRMKESRIRGAAVLRVAE